MPVHPTKKHRQYLYQGDPLAVLPPPELEAILDRHRDQPDALITVLEEIQDHYGYLPQRQLQYTARELGFPLSRVYGVATFYNLFHFTAPGRYMVRVCRGTACHVNGSQVIIDRLKQNLGVNEDESTSDGLFSLQTVACMGACSLAPVLVVNERTFGRMTPERAIQEMEDLKRENQPQEAQA
jgi:NADH:ubiquinone oxidoreductase subunit E